VLAGFNQPLGFAKSRGVDEHNMLLFRRRVEEVAIHNESLFKQLTRYPDLTKAVKKSTTCGPHLPPGDTCGYGRLIVLMELRDRAEKLESRQAEHFVFPSCEHGYFDANRAMKNWRTAWRTLTRAVSCPSCEVIQRPAAVCKNEECHADIKGLKSPFDGLRFHDLRHQAITELAEKGVPEQTLMGIAGHVSRRMLDHYSHARLAAKRAALDGLTSQSTSQIKKLAEASPASDSLQMGPTGLEPMTSCV
jgi:Phage integrase family